MDTKELHGLAARHLVHHGLLSDIVPADQGPIFARAEGSLIWDTEGGSISTSTLARCARRSATTTRAWRGRSARR